MKKNTYLMDSEILQMSVGTLILAMRDYLKAKRKGNAKDMTDHLELAEACIQAIGKDADYIAKAIIDSGELLEEGLEEVEEECKINVPKQYN